MDGKEPIPNATQFPEKKSSPEAPNGGIKVEVYQPDMIHKLAQKLGKSSRNIATLNNTDINDQLLIASTNTSLYSRQGENECHEYKFESWINFSENVRQRPDSGYYAPKRVANLQQKLEDAGYSVQHKQIPVYTTSVHIHQLVLSKNGQTYDLRLGFGSRKEEEEHIKKEVELLRKENPNKPSSRKKDYLARSQRGFFNEQVWLSTQPRGLALDEETPASEGLDGKSEFINFLEEYARTYQDIINTIYKEAKVQHPKRRIITLRPPVLSYDALTQVASTETKNPIYAVTSELIQKMPSFKEIAGQDGAVTEAKRLVLAINHPELYKRRGAKRPKGILLYGPPGTGKTMLAQAVAREANATLLQVSVADIDIKWFGESERLMQRVFDLANKEVEQGRKVILFFDELDSLAPSREKSYEATRKVVAILLQNMDGMRANPDVTVIATSNRPQDIDPALKRAGRFDKLIPIGLPDNKGKVDILTVHIEKAERVATGWEKLFSPEIDLAHLAEITGEMNGADLANLVNLALEDKVILELEGKEWSPITTDDMVATIKKWGMIKREKRKIGFAPPANEK